MPGKQTEDNKELDEQQTTNGQQSDNANGDEDTRTDDNNAEENGNDGGQKHSGGRTFSQEDVSRMMTKEKQQGRNSVYRELGIDPNDTKAIDLIKTLMASQNATTQNEDPVVDDGYDEKIAEAEHRAQVAEAKAEAMMLGVKPEFVDDVVTLATARMAEQEGAEFKTIIGEMKTRYSAWFGVDSDDKSSVGQKGTGSSIGSDSGSKGSKKEEGLGKRLAAQRKTGAKKNFSYWGSK